MKYSFPLFILLCFSVLLYGQQKKETLDTIRNRYPDLFVDAHVIKVTYDNQQGYMYRGNAEQLFSGDFAEPASELYAEAELDAKANLYEYFKKDDENIVVVIRRARIILNYKEGNIYGCIFFVPEDSVSVNKVQEQSIQIKSDILKSPNVINQDSDIRDRKANISQEDKNKSISENAAADAAAKNMPTSQTQPIHTTKKEKPEVIQKVHKSDDANQTIISYLKLARRSVRRKEINKAEMAYREAIMIVTNDESIDRLIAYETVLEAADFEVANGNRAMALKYYRLFLKCNHTRNWKLSHYASEVNHLISLLLAKI